MIGPGAMRGLSQASNQRGVFSIFAIDHRDAMRLVLAPDAPDSVKPETLTDMKLEFVRALSPEASAILLDPEYSAVQAVSEHAIAGGSALLCAIESQGYLGDPEAPTQTLLDGWSIEKSKRIGASGVKLLLLYRPETSVAARQEELVRTVITECRRLDIPLFLEPVAYDLPNSRFLDNRRRIVTTSVERLGALGPDVLKVQFPARTDRVDRAEWADACAELDDASPVPWTLLSGGDPFESFITQVELACAAGSSGFVVGRALWAEAARADDTDRSRLIETRVVPRFRDLTAVASDLGTPFSQRVAVAPVADFSAYADFGNPPPT